MPCGCMREKLSKLKITKKKNEKTKKKTKNEKKKKDLGPAQRKSEARLGDGVERGRLSYIVMFERGKKWETAGTNK